MSCVTVRETHFSNLDDFDGFFSNYLKVWRGMHLFIVNHIMKEIFTGKNVKFGNLTARLVKDWG